MSRQVIINADDFGLSPGVNQGIIQAYQAGGITSTSMMVNMPGLEDALSLARSLPELGVGLHFNLTYGRPVSDPAIVPSLVKPDGSFHQSPIGLKRDIADIAKELDAQWNVFVQASRSPTHLDSHQLLHQNDPIMFQIMAEKAVRENIPLRRSQIQHSPPAMPDPRMTDTILLDTYGDQEGLQRLLLHLSRLPDGITEIVCHPGYVDDALREISSWLDIREHELAVFVDQEIPQTLQALGIVPINYKALKDIPDERCILPPIQIESPPKPVEKKGSSPLRQRILKRKRMAKIHRLSQKRRKLRRSSSTRKRV
ncbi:ChbG/HpnK family deacetylase [Paenibacillus sp. F6_3S_P_1C]|uniref:ChbG/HpnK family deacetylase n=1 Tax=Paenibacillus vandeheii TaxID=3035917 RepID=A0ABT8JM24_9BACL|nr:ChbG/HpnK family deacetylase [Paenibacillus vandeheii]MDN4605219.1 ChbG/HpnK family deacetylase [Paenibacillus vandeheii]